MANYIDEAGRTETAGYNYDFDTEIIKWLKTNNLRGNNDSIIKAFKNDNDITVEQLKNLNKTNELIPFLKELGISSSAIYRISSQIKQLVSKSEPKRDVIRIYISKQEQESMNKLTKYKQEIESLVIKMNKTNEQLSNAINKYDNIIQQSFDELMLAIISSSLYSLITLSLCLTTIDLRAFISVGVKSSNPSF